MNGGHRSSFLAEGQLWPDDSLLESIERGIDGGKKSSLWASPRLSVFQPGNLALNLPLFRFHLVDLLQVSYNTHLPLPDSCMLHVRRQVVITVRAPL
jgi:hypothetical protein